MLRKYHELAETVQGGGTFSEAWRSTQGIQQALHKHGESWRTRRGARVGPDRLAEFQEKAQRIKNKVVSAMFIR